MRFVHTSDIHLGKRLKERSLVEDQRYILEQILDIVKDCGADALLIAGDVYDEGNAPTNESVNILDWFLTELSGMPVETLMISGNHDSMDKLNFGSGIFGKNGIHVASVYDGEVRKVTVKDVDFYLLPFIKPAHVRKCFGIDGELSYEAAVQRALSDIDPDDGRRKVLMTHQFVTDGGIQPRTCDSERTYVGGSENIDYRVFDGFDYVALGHLHSPQSMGRPEVRYCGSPLKYSKSEVVSKKSVTIVDIDDEGVRITERELVPLRDVRTVTGTLEWIVEDAKKNGHTDDYIFAELTEEHEDAIDILRTVFPNFLSLEVKRKQDDWDPMGDTDLEHIDLLEEFCRFYREKNGEDLTPEQMEIVKEIMSVAGVIL